MKLVSFLTTICVSSLIAVQAFAQNVQNNAEESTALVQEYAEEQDQNSCETKLDVNLDIYSSYIWRGVKLGNGASLQPALVLRSNNFVLGAKGNISTNGGSGKRFSKDNNNEAFEANLFASYSFPFGLKLGVNDYYSGGNYLGVNFNNMAVTHAIEPFFEYTYANNLSFLAALMFFENKKADFYCEVGYDFDIFNLALGAGNGQYTINPVYNNGGDFSFCNITISKEKVVKITDSFKLPVKGGVTLNPTTERLFVYVGVSL